MTETPEPMGRLAKGLAAAALFALAATTSGCTQNQALGRDQLILVSNDQLATLADGTWQRTLQQQGVVHDADYDAQLDRVAGRIVTAAGRGGETWNFAVIHDDSLNAFALPGNKIGVNSGMMKFVQNDDQLAAVIGHEVGHVMARHSAERYSQQLLGQVGLDLANAALAANNTPMADQIAAVLGAGVNYGVILPFSRKQELEADTLGLQYMARAGYDPHQAVDFWRRMMAQSNGQPPEFMSTHPSDQARIANLQAQIRRMGL
ncbi:M48 family metallopeptidase [Tistlia consotensis]|nr:M48 family metallopeptidase [Tistlia consotensis]